MTTTTSLGDAKLDAEAVVDPRYEGLEPEFGRIIAELCRAMSRSAELRGGRATHTVGIMARGVLEVLEAPEVPPHPFFTPGRRYPITLRHASFKGFADDAVWDGRSASIRVLSREDSQPGDEDSQMDLILSNGRTFVLGDAVIFHRWFAANLRERAEILKEYPPFAPSFAEFVRSPESFTALDYYSQIAYLFTDLAGQKTYARFRLTATTPRPDSGFVDSSKLQLPLDYVPRQPDDTRPPTYLRDELRSRVEQGGVEYLLQAQLRPISADDAENRQALDVTQHWPEAHFPFRSLARLRLDRVVPEEAAGQQHLNVGRMPSGLSLICTPSARHPASIAQLRSIVYDAASAARLGRPNPPALQRLLELYPAAAPPLPPGLSPTTLFDDLGPELRASVAEVGREIYRRAAAMGGLPSVASGITLLGELSLDHALPAPPCLASGRRYHISLRYGNEREFGDDAIYDGRYALLRIFAPANGEPGAALPVETLGEEAAVLDLILYSGRAAPLRTGRQLMRWLIGSRADRAAVLADCAGSGERLQRFIRNPDSYATLHYYGWVTGEYLGAGGERRLARYRLVPVAELPDGGYVDPALVPLPLDFAPRQPGDARPPTYLRDELRARLAGGTVTHVLQVQLRPQPDTVAARHAAADPTQPWPEESHPWQELARLTLERESPVAPRRDIRPERLPPGLQILRAYSDTEPASMAHLFAIVNDIQIRLLYGQPMAAPLEQLIRERYPNEPVVKPGAQSAEPSSASRRRRVGVIGGGAAGLTAAFELKKRGHLPTVFERAESVGGKSAAFAVDGHTFDLGTHICTSQYRNIKDFAAEVGCATELLTPLRTYDVKRRALYAPGTSFISEMVNYVRLLEQKAQRYPKISLPGLHHESRTLSESLPDWIAQHQLSGLLKATGLDVGYTSSGYGFLSDPELATLYYLKFVELSGFLDPNPQDDYQGEWTIAGCFMNLWQKVAERLDDVRCSADVKSVERRADGVTIRTADGDFEFDDLVVAVPLERSLEFLDASDEERDLFSRIRHNPYYTTVASATGLPRDGFYMLQQYSIDDRHIGRCTAFHHRYADSDVYTFYAYGGPGLSDDDILRLLKEDVETLGGQLGEVHGQKLWNFFPHVTLSDVKAGYFERIEALQGQRRTYYTGSLLSFELIECVVGYSRDLVGRHFAELGEGAAAVQAVARPATRRARHSEQSIRSWLIERLAQELQLPAAQISPAAALESFAIDSIIANGLVGSFSEWLGFRVTPALIVEHPTINAIAAHLSRA